MRWGRPGGRKERFVEDAFRYSFDVGIMMTTPAQHRVNPLTQQTNILALAARMIMIIVAMRSRQSDTDRGDHFGKSGVFPARSPLVQARGGSHGRLWQFTLEWVHQKASSGAG